MIPLLPKWNLHGNRPTFYDADAVTMLELASTLHASMNNIIDEYNKLEEAVNKTVEDFMSGVITDREEFEVAMRQEFQDFIDTINLKVLDMDNRMTATEKSIVETANKMVNDAIKNNEITVKESYDPDTESLTLIVSGGV